jgi:hypothetical protein
VPCRAGPSCRPCGPGTALRPFFVSGRHDGPTGPSGWCRPIGLGRPVPYPAMPSSSSGYDGGRADRGGDSLREGPGGSHGGSERGGGSRRRAAQISRPAPRRREGGRLARLRLALMATAVGAAPPCAPGGDGGQTSRWKRRSGRRGGAGERKRWGSGRLTPGGGGMG